MNQRSSNPLRPSPSRIALGGLLLGMLVMTSGCVVSTHEGYREGYYDRDHNRWYHEGGWHDCGEHDEHCR